MVVYEYKVKTKTGLRKYAGMHKSKQEAEQWLLRYKKKFNGSMRTEFVLTKTTIKNKTL